jgi:tetratricopeptide (TPR) repeat protein
VLQLSRRQLLELGIAAFISRLTHIDSKHISAIEREELGRALGENIAAGWKVFLKISNAEALAFGQFQLSLLHEAHTFVYPSSLPYLYRGTYDLIGISLYYQESNEKALKVYHDGYNAALAISDPWYIAQNLICQADSYNSLDRYGMAIQVIEEALRVIGKSTDESMMRTRAHLLSCWADSALMLEEYTTAQEKLENAAIYLDYTTLSEEFDRTSWLQLAGKKALMEGEYQQAIHHLEEALVLNPPQWVVRHASILTPLAIAYARMQQREQSLVIARQAIPVIGAVNAPMTNKHFLEYIKHDIMARFPHDSQVRSFLMDMQERLPQLTSLVDAL